MTYSYVASFAEIEVDVETGKYYIVDFLAYADVGTVIHPRALGGQVLGRSTLGIGHAIGQKWVFDPHYGVMVSKRFHHNKPPTILDVPVNMQWEAWIFRIRRHPWRSRYRRTARWRRMRLYLERPLGRPGRRDLPARARQRRHDFDFAGSRAPDATSVDGAYLIREEPMAVIRDVMPAFELFQPTSLADAQKSSPTAWSGRLGDGRWTG